MLSLGYNTYVTQGGDWGSLITRAMGMKYPSHIPASHLNMAMCGPPSYDKPLLFFQFMTTPFSEGDKQGLARSQWFQKEGSGYNKEQSTKPQT